ncbi:hypothetical protein JS44_12805 [Anoxybacillus flavithermus]|uniref:Uncharacterized protein n=1 Tax=Anoxybacillus flavithermus TaxID=33934 RepID=A0A094IX72_9BACL|nr:hypothetical protein JS44_12805 [Anoxybacillus flavithermus]
MFHNSKNIISENGTGQVNRWNVQESGTHRLEGSSQKSVEPTLYGRLCKHKSSPHVTGQEVGALRQKGGTAETTLFPSFSIRAEKRFYLRKE